MSSNTLDNATINKLIPQIFDQMRSNLNSSTTTTAAAITKKAKQQFLINNSSITTQSLLKESEMLDKIIPVIENLNESLRNATPQNLQRIYETCLSTNKVLDAWINIQSQAGHIYDLMDSEQYLEYAKAVQQDEKLTAEQFLQSKKKEVQELIEKKEEKKRSRDLLALKQEEKKQELRKNQSRSGVRASGIPRKTNMTAPGARSSTTRTGNRITKPEYARKMFSR